jgi:cyclopropane-fatty-acyl-phospholipid synthase
MIKGKRDTIAASSLSFLRKLLCDYHPRDFAVRLWDGTAWPAETGQPTRYTMTVNHPGALRKMFLRLSERSLGEAYIANDFDIEGEMEHAFRLVDHFFNIRLNLAQRLRSGLFLSSLPAQRDAQAGSRAAHLHGAPHSGERDRQAVTHHYDISNEFYALWLDERMVYSCAYFSGADDDLDTAQEQKLDYICRKLRLRSGERLLDIGCGWGGLIIHAARNYGVEALGITLSRPQAELANERIRRAGLSDRCRAEVRDYREMDETGGYDKLASVGMFEHVGEKLLPEYFTRAWRLLRPGGVFLNHGISWGFLPQAHRGASFIERYVFPDGELVPLDATLRAAERSGFEVRDVESLREHYELTLKHWVRRLEEHRAKACRLTNELTYRIWRLYMAGSAHGFKTGRINVYQTLLAKPDKGESGLPLTRADWYS